MKQKKRFYNAIAVVSMMLVLITNIVCVHAITTDNIETSEKQKEVKTIVEDKETIEKVEEEIEETVEEVVEEVEEEIIPYTDYSIPSYGGFKSYSKHTLQSGRIRYKQSSLQYKLQTMAYTGDFGIRQVDGRFCVALGSRFTTSIGQYFDLILANGTVIPCVLGDAKSDAHTDATHIFTVANNCCSEFIIDRNAASGTVLQMGNCSWACDEWQSPVKTIRLYEKNVFDN